MGKKKKKDRLTARTAIQMTGTVPRRRVVRVKRNEPCPCGSGKKYKECHAAEGDTFLQQLAQEREKLERLEQLDKAGVPWYRRLWLRISS